MKRICFALAALLSLATGPAFAQTPTPLTPQQVQVFETDLENLVLANSNDVAAAAIVVSDSANVTAAQMQMSADQALQASAGTALQAAEQQFEVDVAALTPAEAKGVLTLAVKKAVKQAAAVAYPPHPYPFNPIPWINPQPYYPPQPYNPGQNPNVPPATPAAPGYMWQWYVNQWVQVPMPHAAAAKADCGCSKTTSLDDTLFAEAITAGFTGRLVVGKYAGLTAAIKQFRADRDAAKFKAATAAYGVNPQRACTLATFAVIGLEMANAFGANIPPTVLAEAVALEAQICGTGKQSPHKAATTNWLSTQFILDGCGGSNGGCGGDDNTTVLGVAKNLGIPLESDYGPYQGSEGRCHTMSSSVLMYSASDWGYADASTTGVASTDLIKAAILKYGGVGCAVAANNSFMNYSGGVFKGVDHGINHDVYLVGWDDAKQAWLMINSWGPGWGISPTTGQATGGLKLVRPTGLLLKPEAVRKALHAVYAKGHARGLSELESIVKAGLPASYNAVATQPPIADQASCGSCWDFSGIRCVSSANIVAGNLPQSAWTGGGCMWIGYGSNDIGTEAVWCVAGAPKPYVAPPTPGPGPQPMPNSPSRRATLLRDLGEKIYARDPAAGEELLNLGETLAGQHAKRLGISLQNAQ